MPSANFLVVAASTASTHFSRRREILATSAPPCCGRTGNRRRPADACKAGCARSGSAAAIRVSGHQGGEGSGASPSGHLDRHLVEQRRARQMASISAGTGSPLTIMFSAGFQADQPRQALRATRAGHAGPASLRAARSEASGGPRGSGSPAPVPARRPCTRRLMAATTGLVAPSSARITLGSVGLLAGLGRAELTGGQSQPVDGRIVQREITATLAVDGVVSAHAVVPREKR
jgi:hypothetical protein